MAKKRMFNKEVLDTDAFLDMPLSAQALYFHLNMRADDDGFVGNPQRIRKYIGASEDDLKLLIAKRFLIVFDDGVVVIKHWRMHNAIQKDRYKQTRYVEDLALLGIKENRAYTLTINKGNAVLVEKTCENDNICIQNVSKMETECTQNVSTDIGIDLDIGIDKDINNNIYDDFFAQCWRLYPRKLGKAHVSDKQKRKLSQDVGCEQMIRCIERYKKYLSNRNIEEKYVMYGSTFFNSGYVDYLDENYAEDTAVSDTDGGEEWQ